MREAGTKVRKEKEEEEAEEKPVKFSEFIKTISLENHPEIQIPKEAQVTKSVDRVLAWEQNDPKTIPDRLQNCRGSFSAVSKKRFAAKYAFSAFTPLRIQNLQMISYNFLYYYFAKFR